MKKIACVITMILIFVLYSNIVFATETKSFEISLTSTNTEVTTEDEIIVTLQIKDFENITEGIYSFLATIEYDKNVFETLTETSVKGLGTWSSAPTFNPENGLILADSSSGVKIDSEVFSITFKVKETAKVGNTEIIIKDFVASEGEEDLNANSDAKIIINVVEKQNDKDDEDNNANNGNADNNSNSDNNGNADNNNSSDNNNGNDNNNNNNNNSSTGNNIDKEDNKDEEKKDNMITDKLPQTGRHDLIIFPAIGATVVLAIYGYLGYKKYSKI